MTAEPAALLSAPARLLAGGSASVTVLTFDDQTRLPANRTLALELIGAGGARTHLLDGATGPEGQLSAAFTVPRLPAGAYTLRARVGSIVLDAPVSLTSTPALLIETDKPIYRPSQTIQGRVVRLGNDLRPQPGPVEVVFLDGRGLRIDRRQLEADEYGVAEFSLRLASEVNEGQWRIRASSEGVASVRDVRVERYVLPRFELDLRFASDWALVDERVSGRVSARYFYGRDVHGSVRLVAHRWVGVWQEYAQLEGTLEDGTFEFELPPVRFVTGTPQNGGQGAVRIDVEVTDATGHTQGVSDSLVISRTPVVFTILPLARTVKPGLPFPVRVESASPSGEPVTSPVELSAQFTDFSGREVGLVRLSSTIEGGSLLWNLDAPPGTAFADLNAEQGRASTSVRVAGSFSPAGNFLTLIRTGGGGPASIGETLSFEVLSTESGTRYYEVFAGGRTVFSAFTESSRFSFPVTVDMVPAARVVAYQIDPANEVLADSVSFRVEVPLEATLDASFNAEEVRPGDEVEVVLDTGIAGRSLLGVSIVDQSVLALGRSRLHLESVFEELERRFLQPVAQLIGGGPEPFVGGAPPPVIGIPFGVPVPTRGAKDVFGELGLVVVATPNLSIPEGVQLDFLDVPINLSPPPESGGQAAAAPESPRLREYFPETWLWSPRLLTDEQGRARLKLQAPDSITGWKLTAVGTHPGSPGGPGITFGETELTVFQDFFVEPSLPESVIRGERFSLKVDLFNYQDRDQTVRVELAETDGLEMLESPTRQTRLGPDAAGSVTFSIRPRRVGEFPLRITALGSTGSDAVQRLLRVVPEGFPVESVENGILRAGDVLDLSPRPPEDAVADSTRAFLSLTPSPVAQSMQGVSDLLMMPYGCGEQNMIFLAPDIEVLKYLREIGELSPEIRIEAENFVNTGYQRQLTFQTPDGGFSAFGGPPGAIWLTAFTLSTFAGAREVRDVDETVLALAAAFLLTRQIEDGSFQPDRFLIHTEMDGGVENVFALTAYVANALAEYGGGEVQGALERAGGFLAAARTDEEVYRHPYALAIGAVALQKIGGFDGVAEQIVDRLLELAMEDERGIFWEPYRVETTGYAAMALLVSGRPEASRVLEWLSTQRNSLGGYGHSTQDTVVALRALFEAARRVRRDVSVRVQVLAGSEVLLDRVLDSSNFDLLHQVQLPADGRTVVARATGQGSVGYQVAVRYHLPGERLPPPRDLEFDVFYDTGHVEVDDIVEVEVRLLYHGYKARTGMVLADVAIPTGFEALRSSLDALVSDGIVQRVEVAGRKHIFYIDELAAGEELRFRFQIRALYPVRSVTSISKAYEYYDKDVTAFHLTEPVVIVAAPREVRVDSVSSGSGAGGTTITLRGSGFSQGAVEVFFNGVAAEVRVVDDNTLEVVVPNLEPAPAEITVVTDAGTATLAPGVGAFQVLPQRFYYPVYAQAGQAFNGFALANLSTRGAGVTAQAIAAAESPHEPAHLRLEPGQQLTMLDEGLSGPGRRFAEHGWVRLTGDNSEVVSLYQFGGGGALDGAPAFRTPARKFWITRIFQGPRSYRGRPASTLLHFANPGAEAATVRLRLYGGQGTSLLAEQQRVLEPEGFVSETAAVLFGLPSIAGPAHVQVEVLEGPGVIGFARVDSLEKETVLGLTGMTDPAADRFWSAQFAHAPGSLYSSVKLINTSEEARQVELAMLADDGVRTLARQSFTVPPAGAVERRIRDLIGFEQALSALSSSLRITADGPGLLGDVLFGDPEAFENAALLPLESRPSRRLAFGHLGDTAEFFTGLALHNTGGEKAELRIRVFSPEGRLLGEAAVELAAGARFSKELRELAPEVRGALGGYVVIESTQPLAAQQLFGDRGLGKLSAVPAVPMR